MAVKTSFSQYDFISILPQYELGTYIRSEPVTQGAVQTIFSIHTTQGKFVFKYYENRSIESVRFESLLLAYLKKHNYPCPAPFKDVQGIYVGLYHNKPYMFFEFIEGQHIDHPNDHHKQQLIQKAAELQNLTRKYHPRYKKYRWNYNVELCRTLAHTEAIKINTKNVQEKFAWLENQLSTLQLPPSLPKGICHCDFHFSNVLFQENQFAALLDFDDANYTFLLFDLVGLIESWAWPHQSDTLDVRQARLIVQEYMKHRPLNAIEQRHLYDVYKLSILIDLTWFFRRGNAQDFYERRKVDFLSNLGRKKFFDEIFLE
ncbi:MAG: homoserine kinase [Chloroflexi bacterium]|nr:homoserine kinase [Chloroflexota bacterium]